MAFLEASVIGVPLQELSDRLQGSFERPLRAGVQAWRGHINEEFSAQAGARGRWDDVEQFGNVPPPTSILRRSGELQDSYIGQGTGSGYAIEPHMLSDTEIEFGSAVPYASVQRDGADIAVTDKMRFFLGTVKGVWLRKDTRFIHIPARFHASATEEVRSDIARIFADWLAGRLGNA